MPLLDHEGAVDGEGEADGHVERVEDQDEHDRAEDLVLRSLVAVRRAQLAWKVEKEIEKLLKSLADISVARKVFLH